MEHEPLVPVETVAKHFGVSVQTVRAWLRQGYFPSDSYIKMGGTYRFSLSRVVDGLLRRPKDDVKMIDPEQVDDTAVQLELDLTAVDQDI